MATSFIQLPPDSTGKKLSTQTDGVGSHMEVHVLADADGTLATVSTLAKDATLTSGAQKTQVTSLPAVSGTVSVSNFPATQPVSGTFWQATQPVSLATNTPDVTDRSARLLGHVTVDNASIPVTGTFWQATQPVSAATLPLPAGAASDASLTNGNLRGSVKLLDAAGSNVASVNSNGSLNVQGYQPTATTFSGVTATGALTSTAATGYNVATVTLRTFTGTTSPSITWKLQASDDNTNWVDLQGINNTTGAIQTTWTQTGAVTAGTAGMGIDYTIGAYTNVRINVTAIAGVTPSAAFGMAFQTMPYEASPGALNQVFNGSTWDVQRGMGVATTTGDTGAKTATGQGATQTNTGNKGVQVVIVLGVVTGTTPTCVFKLQGSVDGGTTWYDIPGAATASLTASTNVGITVYPGVTAVTGATTTGTTAAASQPLPRNWRVVWTIGGTLPSFTITSVTYNYLPN